MANSTTNNTDMLYDKLKEYFGFSSFKGNQEAVIRNVLTTKVMQLIRNQANIQETNS